MRYGKKYKGKNPKKPKNPKNQDSNLIKYFFFSDIPLKIS